MLPHSGAVNRKFAVLLLARRTSTAVARAEREGNCRRIQADEFNMRRSLKKIKGIGAFFPPLRPLTETDLCPPLANHAGGYAHSYVRGGRRAPPPRRIPPHTLSAAEEA